MELTILLNVMNKLAAAGMVIVAIIGFVIGWQSSNFFIPPRDFWTKSGATMIGVKFGIALGGAYFAVVGSAYLISAIFG